MNLILSTEETLDLELLLFENGYARLDTLCFISGRPCFRNIPLVSVKLSVLLMFARDDICINKAVYFQCLPTDWETLN